MKVTAVRVGWKVRRKIKQNWIVFFSFYNKWQNGQASQAMAEEWILWVTSLEDSHHEALIDEYLQSIQHIQSTFRYILSGRGKVERSRFILLPMRREKYWFYKAIQKT